MACLLGAAVAGLAGRASAQPAGPIVSTLDNGLRVVLEPLPGRAFCALAVTYDVGSRDVPPGWTGLAHLTEHLMFSGTDRLDEVEVYLRLEAAGAVERNGETGPDRSIFYELLPCASVDAALYIESQRMARMLAGLNHARLERQREVVLHEGWERGAYGWRGLLADRLYVAVLGEEHPYASIVEREGDVRAVELPHVQWFFQTHYAPDNATLAVVGGFDPDRVQASVERRFGPIRRSGPPPAAAPRPPVHPMPHERRIEVVMQHDRDQLYVAWATPALYAPGDAELDVLSTLLTDRRDAPLRAALLESGLALEASARQRSHELASLYTIEAVPAPGHSPAELLEVIDATLDRLQREPFDQAAVARARERWARRLRLDAEDLVTRAIRLGIRIGDYLPTLQRERERYAAVSSADVARVVARWLRPDRRLVLTGRGEPEASPRGSVRADRIVTAPANQTDR